MNFQRNPMDRATPFYKGRMRYDDLYTKSVAQMGDSGPINLDEGGCGCNDGNGCACLKNKSLAMVYSPCQEFTELYDIQDALKNGTLFMELYKPFLASREARDERKK